MGAGRAEKGEEAFEHKAAAEDCGINKSRMRTKAIIPAVLTRALTVVYLGEKQMNISPFPSSLLQHFEFDVKVKKEKVGRRKIEGWTKKSLSIPWCIQENRPIRKPGMKVEANAKEAFIRLSSKPLGPHSLLPIPEIENKAIPLPISVKAQARNKRMNRGARSPPRYLFC